MLEGTLGTWNINTLDFGLKDEENKVQLYPFPVVKLHEVMFKNKWNNYFR